MATVVFYKQVREDGGVRTGIEINDLTYFEKNETTSNDDDPALVWFADVRCQGKALPVEPDRARNWLLDSAPLIKKGIAKLANDLRAGIDVESYPLRRKIDSSPKGVSIVLVCSASRRLAGLELGKELASIADQWEETIRRLPATRALAS